MDTTESHEHPSEREHDEYEHDANAEKTNGGKFDNNKEIEDFTSSLYMLLNSFQAYLNHLAKNCSKVNDEINQLEIMSIDLLNPIGDVLSLEKEIKHCNEIE